MSAVFLFPVAPFGDDLKGSVTVAGASVENSPPARIMLRFAEDPKRDLLMEAESAAAAESWVSALNAHVSFYSKSAVKDAVVIVEADYDRETTVSGNATDLPMAAKSTESASVAQTVADVAAEGSNVDAPSAAPETAATEDDGANTAGTSSSTETAGASVASVSAADSAPKAQVEQTEAESTVSTTQIAVVEESEAPEVQAERASQAQAEAEAEIETVVETVVEAAPAPAEAQISTSESETQIASSEAQETTPQVDETAIPTQTQERAKDHSAVYDTNADDVADDNSESSSVVEEPIALEPTISAEEVTEEALSAPPVDDTVSGNATATTTSESISVFKGFMKKRGHVVKNWKRRFFVLDQGILRYYADSSPSEGNMIFFEIFGHFSFLMRL
jgi:hypothetical protein